MVALNDETDDNVKVTVELCILPNLDFGLDQDLESIHNNRAQKRGKNVACLH